MTASELAALVAKCVDARVLGSIGYALSANPTLTAEQLSQQIGTLADDDEQLGGIEKVVAFAEQPKPDGVVDKDKAKTNGDGLTLESVAAEVAALKARIPDINKGVEAAKSLAEEHAQAMVKIAMSEGKVLPKDSAFYLTWALEDPIRMSEFLKIAPKVGPELTIIGQGAGPSLSSDGELGEDDKIVMVQLGISETEMRARKLEDQASRAWRR